MSYASPYRGSNYGFYTSYSAYKAAEAGSLAQAPTVSMRSTSRSFGSPTTSTPIDTRTITAVPVSGIYTAAAAIRGGVTTDDAEAGRKGAPGMRTNSLPPGACTGCIWTYDEENDVWYCIVCGCEPEDDCDHGVCVPLTDGWQVWLMMALLAAAYAVRRNRKITQQAILAV